MLAHGGDEVRERKAAWEAESLTVLTNPVGVGRAYQEEGVFPVSVPFALGLNVHIPEGQRLRLEIEPVAGEGIEGETGVSGANGDGEALGRTAESGFEGDLFLDLFRVGPSPSALPAPVQSGVWEGRTWTYDAAESGDYVIRVQPGLDQGGRYRLTARIGARWLFPVAGGGEDDIGGVFGDPRDGGSREHHGVDIFKPRGTPVVAAADGVVSSVDTTEIGGRVVWLRESGGRHSLYYAHLETPLVEDGQRVSTGDTLGLVGNTGNARTTPPHLHFGVYRRGPRDPWPMILPQSPEPRPVNVSLSPLGRRDASLRGPEVLRRSPSSRGESLEELNGSERLTVLAGSAGWYRVALPNGTSGFLPGNATLVVPDGTPAAGGS
jgi:murein DD-endopeptidase MepM/ murein hydrolase activator NlpD